MVEASGIRHDKSWFVNARTGNIKDEYFFEKKLGSGGYGAVYLAKNKQTGKFLTTFLVDEQTNICLSFLIGQIFFHVYTQAKICFRRESGRQSHAEG